VVTYNANRDLFPAERTFFNARAESATGPRPAGREVFFEHRLGAGARREIGGFIFVC